MRKIAVSILLFVLSFHFYGQEIQTKYEDFNNDKVIDSLRISFSSGSHTSMANIQLINGKTGDIFELNKGSDFSQIKSYVIIPEELRLPENEPFLKIIQKEFLSKERLSPDGSLSWIISGTLSSTELKNNKYFNRIINPDNDWIDGKIELPSSYHCTIKGDTLNRLYNYNKEHPLPLHDRQAWIRYHGLNHYSHQMTDSLALLHQKSDLEIYKTAHGIIAKKNNSHKWLFVTDFELTDAPQKLRWESIGKTQIVKGHLIVLQKLTPSSFNNIFIINIETGVCGRLKFNTITNEVDFKIEKGKLIIYVEGKYLEIPIKKLTKELNKCKI